MLEIKQVNGAPSIGELIEREIPERVRREFTNQSSLGFMTTTTNRQLTTDTMFLPGKAFSGGLDWDWRLGKRYSVTGYWAGTESLDQAIANVAKGMADLLK